MRFKQIATYCLSFICVGVYFLTKQESLPVWRETGVDQNSEVMIFRLKEGLLIPIQLKIESDLDTFEQMKQAIQMMSLDLPHFDYEAILPSQCELLAMQVSENHALLDLNAACMNYPKEKELRMLEALIWSATQFDDITSVSFSVEQEKLAVLPYGTPLASNMNRRFGMNNLSLQESTLHDTVPLNLYIQNKSISYIQTFRVEAQKDLHETLNQMASLMAKISESNESIVIEDVRVNTNTLVLMLNEKMLSEEKIVSSDIIVPFLLSVHETFGYEQFQLMIEDEIVYLSGSFEDTIDVTQLRLRQIML